MLERIEMLGIGAKDLVESSNDKEFRRLHREAISVLLTSNYWDHTYVQESRAICMRVEFLFHLWEARNKIWNTSSDIPEVLAYFIKHSMYLATTQVAYNYSKELDMFHKHAVDMWATLTRFRATRNDGGMLFDYEDDDDTVLHLGF